MRVKSISRDRVSIRLSSSYGDKKRLVETSSMSVGPYKTTGNLTFETLVDGSPLKDLTHTVKVMNPNTKVESDIVLEGLASFFA